MGLSQLSSDDRICDRVGTLADLFSVAVFFKSAFGTLASAQAREPRRLFPLYISRRLGNTVASVTVYR